MRVLICFMILTLLVMVNYLSISTLYIYIKYTRLIREIQFQLKYSFNFHNTKQGFLCAWKSHLKYDYTRVINFLFLTSTLTVALLLTFE